MPTPIPYDTLLTEGITFVSDFGVIPVITAIVVVFIGTLAFRKIKGAVR